MSKETKEKILEALEGKMEINKRMSSKDIDVWECKCGTYTPAKKGSPKPICVYCRRGN